MNADIIPTNESQSYDWVTRCLEMVDGDSSVYAYYQIRKWLPEYMRWELPVTAKLYEFMKRELRKDKPFYNELYRKSKKAERIELALEVGMEFDDLTSPKNIPGIDPNHSYEFALKAEQAFEQIEREMGVMEGTAKDLVYKIYRPFKEEADAIMEPTFFCYVDDDNLIRVDRTKLPKPHI